VYSCVRVFVEVCVKYVKYVKCVRVFAHFFGERTHGGTV
jgi:hypothetical protein